MKNLILTSAVLMGLAAPAFAQPIYYQHNYRNAAPYAYAPYAYDDAQQYGMEAYGMAVVPNEYHPTLNGGGSTGYNYHLMQSQ